MLARVCALFLFDKFLFSSFPRRLSPHISLPPSPLQSPQTGFIYSRPGISSRASKLAAFSYHRAARVLVCFFITPPSVLCSPLLFTIVLFLAAPEILGPIFENIKTPPDDSEGGDTLGPAHSRSSRTKMYSLLHLRVFLVDLGPCSASSPPYHIWQMRAVIGGRFLSFIVVDVSNNIAILKYHYNISQQPLFSYLALYLFYTFRTVVVFEALRNIIAYSEFIIIYYAIIINYWGKFTR